MRVLYLTKDLFFSSRVCSLAREAGLTIDVVSSVDACLTKGDTVPDDTVLDDTVLDDTVLDDTVLVIIDLNLPQLEIATAVGKLRETVHVRKILAYGPHVEAAKLAAAEQAGCDLVLPRSQFDQQIASMLRESASLPEDAN